MFRGQNRVTANVRGGKDNPELFGVVYFEKSSKGVLVTAEIYGLPMQDGNKNGFFGFHIHEGGSCAGTEAAGGHYNPKNIPHPFHAGDLPPLMSNNGFAYMTVLTDRFTLNEVIGKTVIIHAMADDFRSQPAGDSGERIACGVIRSF